MNIGVILEVAIGMVFVWLMLAMACMGVQEWIAGLFKFRARDMEKAIRRMIDEEKPPAGKWVWERLWEWLEHVGGGIWASFWCFLSGKEKDKDNDALTVQLYNHPLIKSLTRNPRARPSYIPDKTFALALFDVVMTAGTEASTIKGVLETLREKESEVPQLADQAVRTAMDELITLAADATNDETKLAGLKKQLDSFTAGQPQLKPVVDALLQTSLDKDAAKMLENVAGSAARLAVSNPQVAQSINSLITGVETGVKEGEKALTVARTNVETWFNATMARLSGGYKRRAQIIGIAIGLVLAVVLNVDSLVIANTLWREPTMRQALVAQAEGFKLPEEKDGEETGEEDTNATAQAGTEEEGEETDATAQADKTLAEEVENFSAGFKGLQLPMGWVTTTLTLTPTQQLCVWPLSPPAEPAEAPSAEPAKDVRGIALFGECWVPLDAPEGGPPPGDWGYWLPKILGWAMSGVAAAQGAPYWFDILKKLVNVRSSGKNPAEEKPKKED